MLIRILTDNPGHTFTRNIDVKFVTVIKDMLRLGKDMNVQHILRETLDSFEAQRAADPDLTALLEMWTKEKEKFNRSIGKVTISEWLLPGIDADSIRLLRYRLLLFSKTTVITRAAIVNFLPPSSLPLGYQKQRTRRSCFNSSCSPHLQPKSSAMT